MSLMKQQMILQLFYLIILIYKGYIGGLHAAGAIKIAKVLQNNTTLTIFSMDHNDISDEAAAEIKAILSHNSKLQRLTLYRQHLLCDISSLYSSSISFSSNSQSPAILTTFGLEENFNNEMLIDTATALYHKVQHNDVGRDDLQAADGVVIVRTLQNTSIFTTFIMLNQNIGDEAANQLAMTLSLNTKLQIVALDGNNLQTANDVRNLRSLKSTKTL